MKKLEDKFFKKNIQIWFFGVLLTPMLAFWDFMFNESSEVLSLGNFITNIFFSPILVFSLSTPLWFIFIFINRYFFLRIRSERLLNFLINLLSIIVGMIILVSILGIEKDDEMTMKSFLFIFLQISLTTFFTWIIKVERNFIKIITDKQGSSRPDILDDEF